MAVSDGSRRMPYSAIENVASSVSQLGRVDVGASVALNSVSTATPSSFGLPWSEFQRGSETVLEPFCGSKRPRNWEGFRYCPAKDCTKGLIHSP
jgi:hypothetical protein